MRAPLAAAVSAPYPYIMLWLCAPSAAASAPFTVHLPSSFPSATVGRVRLYLSSRCDAADPPPRAQCSDDQDTSQVFGIDTPEGGLLPGSHVSIDVTTSGYPRHRLKDIPAGSYCVQADLFRYRRYKRGDGANVTLPVSCVSDAGGDGAYGSPPGTLYSGVLKYVLVEPGGSVGPVAVHLQHEVPKVASPGCSGKGADTEWIKTVRVQSSLLSSFWGSPIMLEACVLLPMGFDDHPHARYPLLVAHGHYSATFQPGGRFDDTPPAEWRKRNLTGYAYIDQLYAYYLYTNWSAPSAPHNPFYGARALVITINQPVPFFDDAYSVDSANVGPYGSAIVQELIPAVEGRFRGIGEGWARGLLGGSTGGWEAFAMQVQSQE